LKDRGVAVIVKPEWNSPEVGRFARIHDPEGNGIELWEPPSEPADLEPDGSAGK
jgi:predicted enzyme related to lactoylglutathione lyase